MRRIPDLILPAVLTAILGALAYLGYSNTNWWLFGAILTIAPVAMWDLWSRDDEDEPEPTAAENGEQT